jgi:hypothetical protein
MAGIQARNGRRDAGDDRTPVVLFIGHPRTEAFEQLACTLRRRGVHAIVISTAGPEARRSALNRLRRRLRDRAIYDDLLEVSDVGADGSLPQRLDGVRILDVLTDERTLAAYGLKSSSLAAVASRGLAHNRFPPDQLLDKFQVNEILGKSGVPIPPQFRATELSPRQAAQRLGLPLVVKARTGAGGSGVRIAASIDDIERAREELSPGDPGGAFYQKLIDGRMALYCVVAGPTGPLMEHGVSVEASRYHLGPSASVRLDDDPALLAAGRLAAKALSFLGLADLGFVRDADGRLWHVDANCRCWGNMTSLLGAGLDYQEAYLDLILGRPSRPPARRDGHAEGGEVPVLPFMLYQAAARGQVRRIGSLAVRFAELCRRGPGASYAVIVFATVARQLVSRGLRKIGYGLKLPLRRSGAGPGRTDEPEPVPDYPAQ